MLAQFLALDTNVDGSPIKSPKRSGQYNKHQSTHTRNSVDDYFRDIENPPFALPSESTEEVPSKGNGLHSILKNKSTRDDTGGGDSISGENSPSVRFSKSLFKHDSREDDMSEERKSASEGFYDSHGSKEIDSHGGSSKNDSQSNIYVDHDLDNHPRKSDSYIEWSTSIDHVVLLYIIPRHRRCVTSHARSQKEANRVTTMYTII